MVDDYDGMGQSAVAIYRRHPELLSLPPLGDFGQGTFRTVILRKALLALRAPVLPLVVVDRFLAGRSMTRLYHNLQLHCYWRSVRKALDDRDEWRRLTQGTVILMYHALGAAGERPSRYVLPSRRFRRQLRWLRLRGYRIISLDEYAQARLEGTLPPSKSVVLTFDDGYADNAGLGSSDLHGVHATVFLVAGLVGESNRWTPESNLNDRALLSWDEVRDLRRAGVAVGAHTVSHPRLTDLDRDKARPEVVDSRAVLEEQLDEPIVHFAYPYGKSSESVQDDGSRSRIPDGLRDPTRFERTRSPDPRSTPNRGSRDMVASDLRTERVDGLSSGLLSAERGRRVKLLYATIECPPESPKGSNRDLAGSAVALVLRGDDFYVLPWMPGQLPREYRDGDASTSVAGERERLCGHVADRRVAGGWRR